MRTSTKIKTKKTHTVYKKDIEALLGIDISELPMHPVIIEVKQHYLTNMTSGPVLEFSYTLGRDEVDVVNP